MADRPIHIDEPNLLQEAAMLASDSLALDVQTITENVAYLQTFDEYDEADLRDACKQLRAAVDQVADLTREALILLFEHEVHTLARQDIPEPADDVELIAATRDELERLQEVAQTCDYAATSTATDRIAERIGPEAIELLIRQIVAAGAATLLEIIDTAEAEIEDCDDEEQNGDQGDGDDGRVSEDDCPSGLCNRYRECGACGGSGEDPCGYGPCYHCDGDGELVPDHCCVCGGSPYCTCCGRCGAASVGACSCSIPTDRDGHQVTV